MAGQNHLYMRPAEDLLSRAVQGPAPWSHWIRDMILSCHDSVDPSFRQIQPRAPQLLALMRCVGAGLPGLKHSKCSQVAVSSGYNLKQASTEADTAPRNTAGVPSALRFSVSWPLSNGSRSGCESSGTKSFRTRLAMPRSPRPRSGSRVIFRC